MRYTVDVTIDLPRARVVELFQDPDNLAKWQPGLQSFQHQSGEKGQPGSTSQIIYNMNGREMEMIETINANNLPESMSMTYQASGVTNNQVNRFVEAGDNQTKWVSENEFLFSGLYKLMGIFMRGAFPKQTMKYLNHFKKFAENEK